MCDEERGAPYVSDHVAERGQSDGNTIMSTGPATQLVKDHKRSLGSVLDDIACMPKFHLENANGAPENTGSRNQGCYSGGEGYVFRGLNKHGQGTKMLSKPARKTANRCRLCIHRLKDRLTVGIQSYSST